MQTLLQDLRFAIRMLGRNPGFTAVVVLTFAFGIGASTAIYSAANSVFLNPVPGPDAERLVQIAERDYDPQGERSFDGVSAPVLEVLRANHGLFSDLAWFHPMRLDAKIEDFNTALRGEMVSPNFFSLLNVQPVLGRAFAKDEAIPVNERLVPARDSVIVLNYSWWKSHFAGDAEVIGKTLDLSGRRFTVIGVMPAHFQYPRARLSFWVPAEDPRWTLRWGRSPEFGVLARVQPGVGGQQARAMLDTVAQQFMRTPAWQALGYDRESRRPEAFGFWMRRLRDHFPRNPGADNLRRTLFGLLGAMGFVLLIVCVNVANLTLARTERRHQELAIRAALGAGPVRLTRQLLTETLLLTCLGAVAGLAMSAGGMKLLISLIPANAPRMKAIVIDGHALGFALLVSILAGLASGLAPAWHASQTRLSETLKQAGTGATVGRGRGRYRSTLVVAEIALSLVLLAGAGLMVQSVVRLLNVNPGFDPENLLYVNLWLPGKYADSGGTPNANASRNALLGQLHEQLAALPGVQAVGIYGGGVGTGKLTIGGRTEPLELNGQGCGVAGSDFFRAMGIPLVAGRYFDKSDIGGKGGAVIINESMARLCWPAENAVGKTFRPGDPAGGHLFQVVGVVADTRPARYTQSAGPTFYRPYHNAEFEDSEPSVLLAVRTERDPRGLIPAIRKALKAAEPAMWNPRIQMVRQTLYDSTQAQRTYMLYLVVFAGVGLLLSALGIYGVLACSVARRTREIGIRMAVGAERRQVLAMVLAEGARLISVGVGLGLLAAFWVTRLLSNQLFEVSPTDPAVLAAVVLILFAIALLACYLPVRRAAKIDPMEALRCE
jgi:putative ABC transport system permease protein